MPNERDENSSRTFGIRHSVLVILLTIIAGCLRFASIDKPSIWGDEAATWRRISGTYQQMLDELRTAGFMPGNYLLTWWIKDGFPIWGKYEYTPRSYLPDMESRFFRRLNEGRDPAMLPRMVWTPTHRLVPGGITPTPLVMRFIPALCGTLMVPAMYFLASHLVSRRTALLAALFTCCSAYMLNYSRDAKMYMQLWFFATLHVGCLLWWLEAYKRRPAGLVALSSARRRSAKEAELGAGVAGVLSAAHVGHVARAFVTDSDIRPDAMVEPRVPRLETFLRFACWLAAGFAMIAFHAVGLAIVGIELLIVLATVPQRLRWPRAAFDAVASRIRSRDREEYHDEAWYDEEHQRLRFNSIFCIPPLLSFLLGAFCIVSLFTSYKQFTRFYGRVEPATSTGVQYDVDDAGIGWVDPYNYGRTAPGHFMENATAYLMNWEWLKGEREASQLDPEALKRLWWAAVVLLTAIGAGLVPWKSLLDRMTGAPRDRGPMPATALLIIAAWLLVPAYGIYAASGAWEQFGNDAENLVKVPAVSPVATIASAVLPAAKPGDVEPLRGAATVILKPFFAGDQSWAKTREMLGLLPYRELFVVKGAGDAPIRWWAVAGIAGALVIGALAWRRPSLLPLPLREGRHEGPADFGAPGFSSGPHPFLEDEGAIQRRRVVAWTTSLTAQALFFALAIAVLVVLLVVAFLAVPPQAESVWMPRYLGFVWPAFAIAVCVLIRRLPLLPLRWLVIAGLLTTNLAVFYHRVQYGEPPTADIVRDEITAGDGRTARVFSAIFARGQFGGPGAGGVVSMPAAYYYVTMSGGSTTPRRAFEYFDRDDLATPVGPGRPNALRATLRRDVNVMDAYVWAQTPVTAPEKDFESKLTTTLAPDWAPAEPAKRWTVYDHWTWKKLYVMERHHWKRIPATRPTSAPTKATAPTKTNNAR
jgi:hypothetical protein